MTKEVVLDEQTWSTPITMRKNDTLHLAYAPGVIDGVGETRVAVTIVFDALKKPVRVTAARLIKNTQDKLAVHLLMVEEEDWR